MRLPRWSRRFRTPRRLVLALIVGGASLGLVPGGAQAQTPPTWTGTWADQSYGGEFQLTQDPGTGRVTGTYTFCGGSITGTVSGNTLQGTWTQSQPGCSPIGWFIFTLNATGDGFTGSWGYPDTPTSTPAGSWSGACIAGACTENGAATSPPAAGGSGSCGNFGVFDPPGTVQLDPGDAISYTLESGDATLAKETTIRWGDGVLDSLDRPGNESDGLQPNSTAEFIHLYYESGSYQVSLSVFGTLGGQTCVNQVPVGTVVIPPPTAPLPPAVAARKCDDFLRKAGGRVGRIIRSATSQPRTRCGRAQRLSRTCTTTVVDRRRCKCRYRIRTRVPASGKPKVVKISRTRVR